MTNLERIQKMNVEEMAELFDKIKYCGTLIYTETSSKQCIGCSEPFCTNATINWLDLECEVYK